MNVSESKTFSQWMKSIPSEHDAQVPEKIQAAARRAYYAKIPKICTIIGGVILLSVAFHKRVEFGH